ncbi:unnamed protein product [Rhizophagus irregularis]|nr:unnamed protein product [Rhizophagus irregularis]
MSRRKRSVSALLSNDEESITARSSRKSRAISRVIDEESEESTSIIHTHDRRMVPCNCSKCNRKIVDVRTKLNHEADRDSDDDQDSEVVQDYSNPLPSSFEDYGNPLPEDNPVSSDENSDNNQNVIQRMEMEEIDDLSTDLFQLFITDEESSETDEESNETDKESNESEINNGDNNDYEYTEIFENYAPSVYEQFQDRIKTATEVLIQFIKLLLIEIGGSNFEEFSGSLYLARNILGLKDQHHNFAACLKCHKLYNKKKVEEFQQNGNLTVMKCSSVACQNQVVSETDKTETW